MKKKTATKKTARKRTIPHTGAKTTETPPIHLVTASCTERKMAAIEQTARAVYEVAKALNSVNVQATISHCYVDGTRGNAPAIQIGGDR